MISVHTWSHTFVRGVIRNYEIAPIWGNLSLITYVLYQDIRLLHQRHRLQSSGWTNSYISRAHVFRVEVYCFSLSFILCVALQFVELQKSLYDGR